MCGAAFLVKHEFAEKEKRALLVCDIGGTTTDVGMLLASGLPRQAAAITDVSGVMMNFSCPDVKRCALPGSALFSTPNLPAASASEAVPSSARIP